MTGSPEPDATARRELRLAVLLCLAGAVVVLAALASDWAGVEQPGDALRPGARVGVPGSLLVPGLRALAFVGLAGVVALAATRGRGRTLVGLLVAAAGAAVCWQAVRVAADLRGRVNGSAEARDLIGLPALPSRTQSLIGGSVRETVDVTATAWPWVCVLGGLLLLVAGLLVAARGRRWAALSSRYDAPVGAAETAAVGPGGAVPVEPTGGPEASPTAVEDKQLWDDLDSGRDPTQDPTQDPTRR